MAGIDIIGRADVERCAGRDLGRIAGEQVELILAIARRIGQARSPHARIEAAVVIDADRRLTLDLAVRARQAAKTRVGDDAGSEERRVGDEGVSKYRSRW